MDTRNGGRSGSGTAIMTANSERRKELILAGLPIPEEIRLNPESEKLEKALVLGWPKGQREYKRISAELGLPEPTMLPQPGPIDQMSETDYARYVEMVKATKAQDPEKLLELMNEAARNASEPEAVEA